VGARERWGYVFWLCVGVVFAVPELAAAAKTVPWPTLSATVGHLEYVWSPTGIFVVATIAAALAHVVQYRPDRLVPRGHRTPGGRLARRPCSQPDRIGWVGYAYLAGAGAAVLTACLLGVFLVRKEDSRWYLAYAIWGLIALLGFVVPSVLAYFAGRDVPFPTLFRMIGNAERRVHVVGVVLIAGLAVLFVHLTLYRWPDISHVLNPTPPKPGTP
jgi:hypothetical protein